MARTKFAGVQLYEVEVNFPGENSTSLSLLIAAESCTEAEAKAIHALTTPPKHLLDEHSRAELEEGKIASVTLGGVIDA